MSACITVMHNLAKLTPQVSHMVDEPSSIHHVPQDCWSQSSAVPSMLFAAI